MAANRYGRIYHSNHDYINLRFGSLDKRRVFEAKFNQYHASHDHDGEAPRFEEINAAEANKDAVKDVESVTIDGYYAHEIEAYHEDAHGGRWVNYSPPTCCVPPVISIDREIVASDTLKRHELSAIFTDMQESDYQSLLESVKVDGFMDPVIRLIGDEVLDGWHRYRAAKELNLLRKLVFRQWDEEDEGSPAAFVLARNIERRHLEPAKRAQIVVAFNERFGIGNIKAQRENSGSSNDEPKTRKELAAEAGVSTATIDRAIAIEKEGESEAVIAGEKTAGEVIKARDAATAKKRKKQVLKNMWDTRIQAARDYTGEADTDLNQHLTLPELEMGFIRNNETYAEAFGSGMQRIDRAASFKDFQDRAFEVDEFGNAKVDISELEEEYRAIMTYSGDIRQWKREDWSPDTNWILPLIEAKKKKAEVSGELQAGVDEMKVEASEAEAPTSDDLKTLREKVKAQMPKYKQWYKDSGYQESDLVSRASFSQLIHVLREYRETEQGGAATVEELEDLLGLLKSKSYPLAHKLRQIVRPEQSESDGESDERSADDLALDAEAEERLASLYEARAEILKSYQISSLDDLVDWARSYYKIHPERGIWGHTHINALIKLLEPDGLSQRLKRNLAKSEAKVSTQPEGCEDTSLPKKREARCLENTMSEMVSIEKFDAKLKQLGAHEDMVCDTLHFYYGIQRADLSETPQETLVEISEFIEGFIDKPVEAWPEWIRNNVPKFELTEVSLFISRDDDDYHIVEFTDESSDEVWCKLGELPQELKDALLKLAVEKIVQSEEKSN